MNNRFKIVPALDIIDGKCVRLFKGDYSKKTIYNKDPVDLAKFFLNNGFELLHMVDLDGAKNGHPVNLSTLEKIAKTGIKIEFGGGLRTKKDLQKVNDCGANFLILGSSLLSNIEEIKSWESDFKNKLVAGIDSKNNMVCTHGWESESQFSISTVLKKISGINFSHLICTDINKDGTLKGPNFKQLKEISNLCDIPIFASGGVSNIDDIKKLKQLKNGITGVIVGKAFYEGKIKIEEMLKC